MTQEGLDTIALAVALIVMAIGLVGIVVPMMPGTILIFAAAVGYAIVDGFQGVGWPTLIVLGVLMLISASANIWATSLGARAGGASGWSILAGLAGAFVGMLVLNLPGAIIGAILGVLLVEMRRAGGWRQAFKAGGGWLAGWLLSTILQVILGLTMIAIFYWQAAGSR